MQNASVAIRSHSVSLIAAILLLRQDSRRPAVSTQRRTMARLMMSDCRRRLV